MHQVLLLGLTVYLLLQSVLLKLNVDGHTTNTFIANIQYVVIPLQNQFSYLIKLFFIVSISKDMNVLVSSVFTFFRLILLIITAQHDYV